MWKKQHVSDGPYNGWPRDRFSVSLRGLLSATCLLLGVGGIAYLLWDFDAVPKQVVETSTITVTVPGQPSQTLGARIRQIRVPFGRRTTLAWQVQLPGGQWIDCQQDCVTAFKSRH